MKTLFCKTCLLIIFIVCYTDVFAQDYLLNIDSLKNVLEIEKEDTNKINTLIALANKLCYVSEFQQSLSFAAFALHIS